MFDKMPIMIGQCDGDRRKYPDAPKFIAMALLNEEWAQRNHSQSLHRLAERGGLAPCEALAIMDKRRWHKMDREESIAELKRRCQGI